MKTPPLTSGSVFSPRLLYCMKKTELKKTIPIIVTFILLLRIHQKSNFSKIVYLLSKLSSNQRVSKRKL